ncbi:MAG TPA: SDR family oxidoreductase [Caldimonas sp.]|nr:SDR family oxidoreductase [Caldimonas sp.]
MKVIVIGASRGIGLELVRQYRADGVDVTGSARSEEGLARIRALGASAITLDVADAASAAGLGWQIEGQRFDVAIVNAGVAGARVAALDPPTEDNFDLVMHTNVLGPMRVIPQLAEALAPGAKLGVLSSRMGSIGSRTSASSWLYRASKAALNSVLKDAALTLGDKAVCVALHPGWVRTDMGGAGADIDVETSVAGMRRVIAALEAGVRGEYRNYDGAEIPW